MGKDHAAPIVATAVATTKDDVGRKAGLLMLSMLPLNGSHHPNQVSELVAVAIYDQPTNSTQY